jgi:hypothetical protein
MPPKIDAPAGLKEGFKWHRYQLECISWMKSIEDNTDKGTLIIFLFKEVLAGLILNRNFILYILHLKLPKLLRKNYKLQRETNLLSLITQASAEKL